MIDQSTPTLPGDRVLAFLDILGFRQIIADMPRDSHLYGTIATVMEYLHDSTELYHDRGAGDYPSGGDDRDPLWREEFSDFEQTQFSDSIVLSQEASQEASANRVAFMARNLSAKLLLRGISHPWWCSDRMVSSPRHRSVYDAG